MPPTEPLPRAAQDDLAAWIAAGAPWPASAGSRPIEGRGHWAFEPLQPITPPDDPTGWASSPIDRLIAAGHRAQGVHPVGPADRRALIRRGDVRPDRPAARAGSGRGVRGRRPSRRLRAADRRAARLAPVRRALGPRLARPRPLRRHGRRQLRLPDPRGVPLSRLRDRRLQRRPPLRPVPPRAARRRHPGRGRAGRRLRPPGDRHRLPRPGEAVRHAEAGRHRTRSSRTRSTRPARSCSGSRCGAPDATTTSTTRSPLATITPSTASSPAPSTRSPARRRTTARASSPRWSRPTSCSDFEAKHAEAVARLKAVCRGRDRVDEVARAGDA